MPFLTLVVAKNDRQSSNVASEHMDERFSIFLSLPKDMVLALEGVGEDLAKILRGHELDVQRGWATNPVIASDGTKGLETVLLASAAIAVALTPILREVLQTFSRRPIIFKYCRLEPVEDSVGNPIHDSDGRPVLHWVETNELVQPSTSGDSKSEKLNVRGPWGIEVSYASDPHHKAAAETGE